MTVMLPTRKICKEYMGVDDDFYDEMKQAAGQLEKEPVAAALLEQARFLLVEMCSVKRTEDICHALQCHVAAFVPGAQHMAVAVLLASSLPRALERLRAQGVAEEILIDTFTNFFLWAEHYRKKHGVLGVGELPWVLYAYTGRLFKLGRLMYEIQEFPFAWYGFAVEGEQLPVMLEQKAAADFHGGKVVLAPGLPVVNIHIPAQGRMDVQEISSSLAQAHEFFAARGYPAQVGVCESWLMDSVLEGFLPAQSNIVQFLQRFARFLLPTVHSSAAGYVFGAGFSEANWQQAPEKTSLQRAMKSYLLGGGKLADTGGALWLGQN